MKILHCHLNNCFGITKFDEDFDFSEKSTILIYSPNGTMKTSFANTFRCLAEGKEPEDIISKNPTKYRITADNEKTTFKAENIYVADPEDSLNSERKITTFLAKKELKDEYDSIHLELDEKKKKFFTKLKNISNCNDCENEIIDKFASKYNKDIFFHLKNLFNDVKNVNLPLFDYNYVFDKKGNVAKFIKNNIALLSKYFEKYNELLKSSTLFSINKNNNNFGTYQVEQLLSALEDDSYFDANHVIELSNKTRITSAKELKELVDEEINRIITDTELMKQFKKIDDALSKNNELRIFKSFIENNQRLIPELIDYEGFRKKVWHRYLIEIKSDYEDLLSTYNNKSKRISELILEAKKDNKVWKNIIDIFKLRFKVPFDIAMTNQEDVILREDVPHLLFTFKNKINGNLIPLDDRNSFIRTLSKGELRAFNILQLLFELESRKQSVEDQLIILDDISDSFDYKNKYAIIEYLIDIIKMVNTFKIIILTHNFDFFRTVSSRVDIQKPFMAYENTNGKIQLKRVGNFSHDIFLDSITTNLFPSNIISMIPFTRNIIEYSSGTNNKDYLILTSCLHIKEKSSRLKTKTVFNIIKKSIFKMNNKELPEDLNINIHKLIFKTADDIECNKKVDPFKLEDKLVLAIAIRLSAEKYLLKTLKIKLIETNTITGVQTRVLIGKYREFNKRKQKNLAILDLVSLMTPENIHVNSFMFEPLIDMSIYHLIELYGDVKKLNNKGCKILK